MTSKALYTAFAALLVLSFAQTAQADIYKFVDDDGTIHFSNIPEVGYRNDKVINEKSASRSGGGAMLIPNARVKQDSGYTAPDYEPLDGDVPYADIINEKCDRYGVDTKLVKAIIKAESNFNPNAVSNKGAIGLMQLMPATADYLNVRNAFDPEQNIDGGVRYVRYLLNNFGGDVELTVAAYNCGEGRVLRNGNCVPDIRETKNYVRKVMKLSNNPVTGVKFSRPIYKVELDDGSVVFTDSPVGSNSVSLVQ